MSHIDVVLVKESQWKHPPFAAVEEDGYLYGRGTVDTKRLTVMELAAFWRWRKMRIQETVCLPSGDLR